jgi:hypothetical protein
MVVGPPCEPFGVVQGLETELPSNQTPPYSTPHASSTTSGEENLMGASSSGSFITQFGGNLCPWDDHFVFFLFYTFDRINK